MGKIKRQRKFKARHDPLAADIIRDKFLGGVDAPIDDPDVGLNDGFIPEKTSKQIFSMARAMDNIPDKEAEMDEDKDAEGGMKIDLNEEGDDDEEEVELEYDDEESVKSYFTDNVEVPNVEAALDPEEERLLNEFMPRSTMQTRSLADIIMEKIAEKEQIQAEEALRRAQGEEADGPKIDAKVAKVYRSIGKVLSVYRSGRIPKAFKILPHLANWEELLLLTQPHKWSPQAMYQATRIFISTSQEPMAIRFVSAVMGPYVREDIQMNKNLSPHLYQALRKALDKPKVFIKGFLLPLCEAQDCSLREAIIFGSLLQKGSIPVVHAAVAMTKIALMPFSGCCSLFLRILYDKRYTLPMAVIDASVQHFGTFLSDDRELPVLWHQALLSFIQRYKNDLLTEQVEILKKVINKHYHRVVTPEIRRELQPLLNKLEVEKQRQAARLRNIS